MNPNLVEYLKENLHGILCEGNKADPYKGAPFTKFQEIMTCILFDVWFNKGDRFSNGDELREYVKNNIFGSTIVDEIDNFCKGSCNFKEDLDMVFIQNKEVGKNGKPVKKDSNAPKWVNSFFYQCKSFENFLKDNPSLGSSSPITFLHHDTNISVCNGVASKNLELLAKRVNNGQESFGIKSKDVYQKADIYAIWDDTNSIQSIKNMPLEIFYWCSAFDGNNTEAKFVGISLKQLTKVLGKVKIYNLLDKEEIIEASGFEIEYNPYKGLYFNSLSDFERGNVTAELSISIKWGEEYNIKRFSVKSSGCGDDLKNIKNNHILRLENPGKANAYYKNVVAIELKGQSNMGGKVNTYVNSIYPFTELEDKYSEHNSKTLIDIITTVNNLLEKYNVSTLIPLPTSDAKNLIDTFYKNENEIKSLVKMWDSHIGKPASDTEIELISNLLNKSITKDNYDMEFAKLMTGIKWIVVTFRICLRFLQILLCSEQFKYNAKENGTELDDPGAFFLLLANLIKGAKAISDKCLPYIMIGE